MTKFNYYVSNNKTGVITGFENLSDAKQYAEETESEDFLYSYEEYLKISEINEIPPEKIDEGVWDYKNHCYITV